MKTVVMLAYHYPPLGGVAVMRVLRFSRYLQEFGYKPVVVCVDGGGREPRDPGLLDEIVPGVEVHRVACVEPDNYADSWEIPRQKVVRNLFKTFDFLLFPDDRRFWIGPASRRAIALARQHRASLIWATAQPFSTLVAGRRVQKATGLPLVLDFRDDWTSSNSDFRRRSPRRQAREVALEQEVLKSSSLVVSVTPGIVEALRGRRPKELPEERVRLLPNGFDPAHFQTPTEGPVEAEPWTILHAGVVHSQRSPDVFLAGLWRWLEGPDAPGEPIRARFAGRIERDCLPLFESPPRPGVLECPGFLPHARVRQEMTRAGLLLLLLERVKTVEWLYSGKIFEYLGAGRPILALGPPRSPLADLIRDSGLGTVISGDDPDQVAEALADAYRRRDQGPTANREVIQSFDAREQTRQLAAWFDELVG